MSVHDDIRRLTAPDIRARKGGEPIVCLTSYHAHTAGCDRYCDIILVGDSLGMVMHGLETTVPVTLDMMILQGLAVMRGSKRALVIVDLPFGSTKHPRSRLRSAARVLKETGCGAIKLEGGRRMAETIAFLVERGVPVMGHIGLTPQAINTIGSFRAQGREEAIGRRSKRTRTPSPTRAPSGCHRGGRRAARPAHHRLVRDSDDRHWRQCCLRWPDPRARGHARAVAPRAEIRQALWRARASIERAVKNYAEEVRARSFPGPDNVYAMRKPKP